jgi:hypothetical protein
VKHAGSLNQHDAHVLRESHTIMGTAFEVLLYYAGFGTVWTTPKYVHHAATHLTWHSALMMECWHTGPCNTQAGAPVMPQGPSLSAAWYHAQGE